MKENLTLLTDLYELTMMQGYFLTNTHNKKVVFDVFFRENPDNSSYAVCAGLDTFLDYIENLSFSKEDLEYLRSLGTFKEEFLDYLKDFHFSGSIVGVPEGTVVFPNEPLYRITAPIIEAQLLESCMLNIINHQTLIATKASRVVNAANGDNVLEFGLRRAQSPSAAILGSRACIIGGCQSTSNVLAGKIFNVPVSGTHAHSWIMSFDSEYEAFSEYAKIYTNVCYLLVDTYDTLKSGMKNAIKVFLELKEKGKMPNLYGVRLDSGDLAYLSIEARKMLDENGLFDAKISASSDLDENLISSLKSQGAKITVWGVGTNLITSKNSPALGGVYKICAEIQEDKIIPKIKISENPIKITNPGVKKIVRLYDKETGKIKADLITLEHETIDENEDLTIFDPNAIWKKMTLNKGEFKTRTLFEDIVINGDIVYKRKEVLDIKQYASEELNTLWSEHKRLTNPQTVKVDLSDELYKLKQELIKAHS